ncbi:MAG: copper transporter [Gordonia sp. (in: high G+C Gram-positive bacteria)]
MISMRQHAISLIAVFLALTLGLFLGSGFIGDRVNSMTGADRDRLGKLEDQRDSLTEQVNQNNSFISAISGRVTDGLLDKRSVLVVTSPNAADGDVQALKGLINDAGGTFAGQIGLTTSLVRDENASKLASIIDQSIPPGQQLRVDYTDSGSRTGDLLGVVLLHRDGAKPVADADRDNALEALRAGGFIDYTGATLKPADLVLVVTGGGLPKDSGAQGQLVGRLAAAMSQRGQGGVLTGRKGSADGSASIATVRADPQLGNSVSTVDDVDVEMGRLTAVMALNEETKGRSGAFGTGPGATAITVGAEPVR